MPAHIDYLQSFGHKELNKFVSRKCFDRSVFPAGILINSRTATVYTMIERISFHKLLDAFAAFYFSSFLF